MIGIRADANETVATGHIMRCITIAYQLKSRGEEVIFFIADEYAIPMLQQAGMDYECLHTSWESMEEEVPIMLQKLADTNCHKLLVDSYYVTESYFEAMNKSCKIIYIDDMFEAVYPVDMVINYNAYQSRFPYQSAYKEIYGRNTQLLLGTSYVPLREEFSTKEQRSAEKCRSTEEDFREEKKHVFLSCGGGDTYNALAGILSELAKQERFEGIVFHTVVGRFHHNKKELEEIAGRYNAQEQSSSKDRQIVLYYDVTEMAKLMSRCMIAISAAGTVLFELCAMQVPTVFFVCADNQKYDREFFEEDERMLFAGDIRTDREVCIRRIGACLERIIQDEKLQQEMKRKLHEVTDGNGAARIAERIIHLI